MKAQRVSITHDVKKILAKKRFAACYAKLYIICTEIPLYFVEEIFVLLQSKLLGADVTAAAAAVYAFFVAAQGKLQKQEFQLRFFPKGAPIVGKLFHMLGLYFF